MDRMERRPGADIREVGREAFFREVGASTRALPAAGGQQALSPATSSVAGYKLLAIQKRQRPRRLLAERGLGSPMRNLL